MTDAEFRAKYYGPYSSCETALKAACEELELFRSALKAEDRFQNHTAGCMSTNAGLACCPKGWDMRLAANGLWEKCGERMPEE